MVKITLNLRSKKLFFFISFLGLLFLVYHIHNLTWSIDITGMDKFLYLVIIIFTASMFWIPFQFNEQFI